MVFAAVRTVLPYPSFPQLFIGHSRTTAYAGGYLDRAQPFRNSSGSLAILAAMRVGLNADGGTAEKYAE